MSSLPSPILEALKFESSNWAHGSVYDDPFYQVTSDAKSISPGHPIKVEENVDTSKYLLPPATAMSRFIYQSENLQGSRVPVSAFVLWPYSPKSLEDGFPVIAWAHGTSGITATCAPSNHRSLWQHFLAPYQLAMEGYVVVATDYAGLGVHKNATGAPIIHQYLASPSHANDVVHAVNAAQEIFPELSKSFIVLGHSQGGGTAWATAQRQVNKPAAGYLGAISVAPFTNIVDQKEPLRSIIIAAICDGLASVMPDFRPSDILTEEGQLRLATIKQADAGVASIAALLIGCNLVKDGWAGNEHFQKYQSLIENGGKKIAGPLLVIHGETDEKLSADAVERAVRRTIELHESSQLEYVSIPEVTHVPALQASQRLWMEWIVDRFAGRAAKPGFQQTKLARARPVGSYQPEQNWYLEAATQFFHAP